MSNDNNFGAGFSIDISNFKAGLAAANKLIRESEAEFKAAAAGMDDWSKSQEGLEKRVNSLNKIVDVQSEKVKALQREKERIISTMQAEGKSHEEIARAVDDVNGRIIKESNTLDRYKKDLDKAEGALDKFNAEQEDAADAANDAERKLKDVGEAAEDAGDGFTVAKGAIAGFISNGLSALVSKVGETISSIAGLADETREYRNEMAKLDTSFETAGLSAESAQTTFKDLYGIMADEGAATEAAQQLAKISDNQKELDANTRILTGVWAEYGNSIPLEGLAEGIAATSNMGSVQGVLADALEWQGVNLDDFNEKLGKMSTEEERAAYIQETLTDLYGESADKFRENNESVIAANEAQADYNDKMAELGEKVEPITTAVKEGFTQILDSVLALVEDVDTEAISESIAGGFKTFVDEVIPAIKDGFQWVLDNKDGLIAGVAGIGGAFVAFKAASLVDTAVSAFKAFKLANEGATVAQWLMNAAMNANPIMLIVTLVGGLIAALVTFVATNEDARAKFVEIWENIKAAFVSFGEKIKETFDKVKKWFSELGDKAAEIWGNLKQGAADAWEGIKNIFSKVASFFGDIFGDAWSRVKNIFSTGGKIFDGIKEGISSTFTNIVNRLIRGINKIVAVPFNAINSALTKIKNVEIANYKPFADKISTISVPEIPELAEGGILTRATHVIAGEAGAEAVLPLEKNTGWMDMFAEKLASKMPAAGNVYQTNHFSQAHSRYELYKTKQQTLAALRLATKGG
ncbi:MAG: hypothetical protein IKU08_09300 [Clostridia bacterium]|nr:hypothetical protein [Clostridia bacterium]